MSDEVTTALIAGGSALGGAFIGALAGWVGAWISGRLSLKSKKIELWFGRKADAYQRVLNLAGEFAADPYNQEKYLPFIGALDAATIVASPKVADLLINPKANGLSVNAQRLRKAQTPDELQKLQMKDWYDAMKRVGDAMREDVASVALVD
jgi:hypothetical protein